MKNGLSIESAASVALRDIIQNHMQNFALVIRTDKAASRSTVAAYVDGLAGAVALAIAGRHGSREDVVGLTIAQLIEAIDRDLKHLAQV